MSQNQNRYDNDVWKEISGTWPNGNPKVSWVATKDMVESELPELFKNIEWQDGATYDDGAKYRYRVTYNSQYGFSLWRNEKSGRFRKSGTQQTTIPNLKPNLKQPQQFNVEEDLVDIKEGVAEIRKAIELLDARICVDITRRGGNPNDPGINKASSYKNDHNQETTHASGADMPGAFGPSEFEVNESKGTED